MICTQTIVLYNMIRYKYVLLWILIFLCWYIYSYSVLDTLSRLHVLVKLHICTCWALAHNLHSCCRYTTGLLSLLAERYTRGWVWSKTATLMLFLLHVYVYKSYLFLRFCNNISLANPVIYVPKLILCFSWDHRKDFL